VHEFEVSIGADDGATLAGTLKVPDGDGPFAALMEALPYRKDDVTASYRETYARYVAAGFAVLRLDLRGTGSSTGVMTDEYPDIERRDLRRAIEWLATQPWSTGRVGMLGTSYSGFNSLQMAAEGGADALAAVVAMYATDDRYTDDVHWCGGVLRGIDLIDYPLYMVAMNALPPVPAVFGDGWREEWRRRVEATPPWLLEWLSHPVDGPTWRRGSIRLGPDGAGYERMSCPTMLVGGWADGYRNNTFRVIEQYERNGLPWRLIAGPWSHRSPERARPGPNIDIDREVVAFFDEHLRDGPRSAPSKAQIFVRRPVTPEPDLTTQPGVWREAHTWPPPGQRDRTWRVDADRVDRLEVRGDAGVAAWNSCAGALPWGQPLDQGEDNARSLCYDWALTDAGEVLGTGTVTMRVRSDRPYGHVSVKLCDVFADGTSALITRGMLDLTHRGCWPADPNGAVGQQPAPLIPGEWLDVAIEFGATTWTLEPGHSLRLAIAGTDWPNCWPPPGPVTLEVETASVELRLPVADGLPASVYGFVPAGGPAADDADGVVWRVERDVLRRQTEVVTRYGGTHEGLHEATVTSDYRGRLGVSTRNPADAWAEGSATLQIQWSEATCRSEATLSVRSDEQSVSVEIGLVVSDGDDELTRRHWDATLPR
jgi:predicted acyl esterase